MIGFLHWLRILAIGYYLGNSQPNEALVVAYARALEFESSSQLFKASPATIAEREAPEFDRLLAKFRVSRDDSWVTLIDAFKRMVDGFSERYKEVLHEHAREYGIEWPLA